MANDFLPIFFMLILAAGVAIVTLTLSHLLGPRKPTTAKLRPYECGVQPLGPAKLTLPPKTSPG
jgi:NADH-quinone oxidoreductase subunit A